MAHEEEERDLLLREQLLMPAVGRRDGGEFGEAMSGVSSCSSRVDVVVSSSEAGGASSGLNHNGSSGSVLIESLSVCEEGEERAAGKRGVNFSLAPIRQRMLLRKATAELIGTFVIVLASCASTIAAVPEEEGGTTAAEGGGAAMAVSVGMAVMLMVWALGPISSAHLNPAVTLGFAVAGLFPWPQVAAYIISQILGSTLASLSLLVIVHDTTLFSVAINQPVQHMGASFVMEFVATFILMLINMKVACNRSEVGELGGSFMIGSTVSLFGYYARPLCGGLSMNPARSIGPALVALNLKSLYIFIIAPIIGATLSGLAYIGIKPTKNDTF